MFDLAVHGSVYAGDVRRRWVYIAEGMIAKVRAEETDRARRTLELGAGQFLIPAATDLHVHLRDWDQSSKETVETGTMSALAGGVTTVAEMPNTSPRLDRPETVRRRVRLLGERSYVDYAVHAAVPPSSGELAGLREAGAFAVKLYPQDLEVFQSVARSASRANLKIAVHAEDQSLLGTPREGDAEVSAVRALLGQVKRHQLLRFAHLSTAEAVRLVRAAKSGNPCLSLEAAPHHLFTSLKTAVSRIGPASKVRPPLRSSANAAEMRRLLRGGAVDFCATDHAPHTTEEKYREGAPGFPGLEIALPLLLSRTRSLPLACRVFCEAPASYLGVRKGRVAPGYMADLVILSKARWTVDPERFHSMGRVTPFAGEPLDYRVDEVLIRGRTCYRDGTFTRRRPSHINPAEVP